MHKLSKFDLEAIVGSIPAGVVVVEKEGGKIIYVNKRAIELIGFDPSGLGFKEYATNMIKIRRLKDETQTYEQLPLIKALLYGQTTRNQELIFYKPDQTQLTIIAHATPITAPQGNITGALAIFEDVTERKQTEDALKESEQLYRTIFENSEDAFQLVEPIYGKNDRVVDYKFLKVNKAFEPQTGIEIGDIIGKTAKQLAPNIEPAWVETHGYVAKTGKTVHKELYNDYSKRWYDAYFFPFTKGTVGVLLRDITQRKQAEEALRKKEEEFRALVQSSSDVVYRMSPDWKEMCQLRGANFIPATEEPSRSWTGKYIHPDDQKHIWAVIQHAIKTKSTFELEHRVIRVDGTLGWMFSRAIPLMDKEGNIVEWLGTAKDVTERRKTEEQLKQRTGELAFERERFFNMVEELPVMVCLITPDYQVPYANRLFREKFGDSAGQPCYLYCGGQNAPCSMCESMVPLKTGKPHHWVAHFPNGLYVEVWDFPFTDVDGKKMILEVDVDITEKVNLQKQLKEKERMAAIGQTAGMVGHDIRNPLQAITSDIYLLKDHLTSMSQCQAKDEAKESLESIEKNIDYINKIVSDLQDFAKPLKPEPVKVDDLCKVIEQLLSTIQMPSTIEAQISCDNNLPALNLDLTFLKRILVNLATNAIQAMPKGGKLCIKAIQRADVVQLVVEDNGVGIPEELKPKMFTPLLTTKAKGQGFGLAVVKRYTEALSGTISFESQVGKGTKFIVELPTK